MSLFDKFLSLRTTGRESSHNAMILAKIVVNRSNVDVNASCKHLIYSESSASNRIAQHASGCEEYCFPSTFVMPFIEVIQCLWRSNVRKRRFPTR